MTALTLGLAMLVVGAYFAFKPDVLTAISGTALVWGAVGIRGIRFYRAWRTSPDDA